MSKKYEHEFTINRSKWANGSNDWEAMLQNKGGQMCCLGFLASSCGVRPADRLECVMPQELKNRGEGEKSPRGADKLLKLLGVNEGPFASKNDDRDISNARREYDLTRKFASIGVKVNFVGKYPKVDAG